jgi:putative SOS response-associated peptidase YedK
MCGKVRISHRVELLIKEYKLGQLITDSPSSSETINMYAEEGDLFPLIRFDRNLHIGRFGLNLGFPDLVINARAETLIDRFPGFQPCIVPVSEFFERGNSFANPQTLPLAGICDESSFAIVTTEARGPISLVHDRMPVILDKVRLSSWMKDMVAYEDQSI